MPFTKWSHSCHVPKEDVLVTPSHAFVFADHVLVQAQDEVGLADFGHAPTEDADVLAALVRGMD